MATVTKEQLKEYITSHPGDFNMHVFLWQDRGCLAGLTVLLSGLPYTNTWDFSFTDAATEALGIESQHSYELFYLHHWPMSLRRMYDYATSDSERVQAGCLAIDWYWETYP